MLRVAVFVVLYVLHPLVSNPAWADGERDHARPGPYVLAGLSLGIPDFDRIDDLNRSAASTAPTVGSPIAVDRYSVGNLIGFEVAAGYRISKRFAIEIDFEWMNGESYADVTDATTPSEPVRRTEQRAPTRVWHFNLGSKLFLMTGRLQPFVLGSAGIMGVVVPTADGDADPVDGFGFRFGGGADYYVTRHAGVNVAVTYDLGTGRLTGQNLTSLAFAVFYRF